MQRHTVKLNAKPATDRRTGRDRRQADKGPPGGRERRVGMEPRRPEVQELEITPSEWASLADTPPPSTSGQEPRG